MLAGVDPGREKFGWVLAGDDGTLFVAGIAAVSELPRFREILRERRWDDLGSWCTEGNVETVPDEEVTVLFLGNGTGSETMQKSLSEVGFSVRVVDERYSTLEARGLYWALHPPRGIRCLLPLSFQVPPRPLDDLAAWSTLLAALGVRRDERPSWCFDKGRVK